MDDAIARSRATFEELRQLVEAARRRRAKARTRTELAAIQAHLDRLTALVELEAQTWAYLTSLLRDPDNHQES